MSKLENLKSSLFAKEAMKKTKGGMTVLADVTKTKCNGTTTTTNGQTVQDCGDSDQID